MLDSVRNKIAVLFGIEQPESTRLCKVKPSMHDFSAVMDEGHASWRSGKTDESMACCLSGAFSIQTKFGLDLQKDTMHIDPRSASHRWYHYVHTHSMLPAQMPEDRNFECSNELQLQQLLREETKSSAES